MHREHLASGRRTRRRRSPSYNSADQIVPRRLLSTFQFDLMKSPLTPPTIFVYLTYFSHKNVNLIFKRATWLVIIFTAFLRCRIVYLAKFILSTPKFATRFCLSFGPLKNAISAV